MSETLLSPSLAALRAAIADAGQGLIERDALVESVALASWGARGAVGDRNRLVVTLSDDWIVARKASVRIGSNIVTTVGDSLWWAFSGGI